MDSSPTAPLDPPALTAAAARVASAAVTVIAERGFDELSVRTVAAQLGMSGGAVQHHFPTRAALLHGAMMVVVAAMTERLTGLETLNDASTAREVLLAILREALPLDQSRRAEGAVWVALSAAGATHPELRDLHRGYLELFVGGLAEVISTPNLVRRSITSARVRAQILAATVDGLTLQGITGNLAAAVMTEALSQAVADALS